MDEQKMFCEFISEIQTDDVVYDIGANKGSYSIGAANGAAPTAILAFEPHGPTFQDLVDNLRSNSISIIQPHKFALSDQSGTASLQIQGEAGHGLIEGGDNGDIETRRADEFIRDTGATPDVIKVDVEGGELGVLRGFGESLGDVRTVFCEVHHRHLPKRGEDPDTVRELLREHGFDIEQLGTRRYVEFIRASRPETPPALRGSS